MIYKNIKKIENLEEEIRLTKIAVDKYFDTLINKVRDLLDSVKYE